MLGMMVLNLVSLTVGHAAELRDAGEQPPGQIVFLSVARSTRRRGPAITDHHSETLLRAANYLGEELRDPNLPAETRVQVLIKIGELTAAAWAHTLPVEENEMSPHLRRLVTEARAADPGARVAAEAAVRSIVEVLGDHARAPAFERDGVGSAERAIAWLGRLDHRMAVSMLLVVTRDARQSAARERAAVELGRLARRHAPDRFAESCARLLLE